MAAVCYTIGSICMRQVSALGCDPSWAVCVKESITVLVIGPCLIYRAVRGLRVFPPVKILFILILAGLVDQLLGNLALAICRGHRGYPAQVDARDRVPGAHQAERRGPHVGGVDRPAQPVDDAAPSAGRGAGRSGGGGSRTASASPEPSVIATRRRSSVETAARSCWRGRIRSATVCRLPVSHGRRRGEVAR